MMRTLMATVALAAVLGGAAGSAHAGVISGKCDEGGTGCCYPIDTPVYKHTQCFDSAQIDILHP